MFTGEQDQEHVVLTGSSSSSRSFFFFLLCFFLFCGIANFVAESSWNLFYFFKLMKDFECFSKLWFHQNILCALLKQKFFLHSCNIEYLNVFRPFCFSVSIHDLSLLYLIIYECMNECLLKCASSKVSFVNEVRL